MPDVEIGVIGAGNRAQDHYTSLASMDDVTLRAVCDVDPEALAETGERYGIEHRYADYQEMLAEHAFDGVYVIMPPEFLHPIVVDALDRGENVFTEKPPGLHSDQTKKWAAAAEANGCHTCVGFQRRFHPVVRRARQRIEAESEVRFCTATFHKQTPDLRNQFALDVLHVIDLLCWVGDGVDHSEIFYGQLFTDGTEYDQFHANAFGGAVRLKNGGIGILNSNRTAGGRNLRVELHGNAISAYGEIHGRAQTDELAIHANGEPYTDVERTDVTELLAATEPSTRIDGTYQINRHFVECLRDDETPGPTFADTVETMETAEAMIQNGNRIPAFISE